MVLILFLKDKNKAHLTIFLWLLKSRSNI